MDFPTMSWNKEQFKSKYNRMSTKKDDSWEHDDGFDEDLDRFLYDEPHITMTDIVIGRLLTLLAKIRIKEARDKLKDWWW